MEKTRRELLGAGASAALGLLPLGGNRAAAQTAATTNTVPQGWDDGEVAHLLPTSNHNRILVKASFKNPLDGAPNLQVGDQRVVGQRSDTRGSFWQFQAADLKPATTYQLSLTSTGGRALCQPWTLSTMPAPEEMPSRLRLLGY